MSVRMFRGGGALVALLFAHSSLSCQNDGGRNLTARQQAFSLANVALGKRTSQSSTDANGASSRAVDGNTSGFYWDKSVTHTEDQDQPWWKVEFGGPCWVEKVTLWNRTDCCRERLANYHMDYLDTSGKTIKTFYRPGQAATRTEINLSSFGVSSVRVRLNGRNVLSLAEVQVWGACPDNLVELHEAEDHTSQTGCTTASSPPGFTGSGFVDFGGTATWIEWDNIQVALAGNYALTFRHSCGDSNRPCAVIVNGENQGCLPFATTGDWKTWGTDTITVPLVEGTNTIRIMANRSGGPNLDNMEIKYVGNKVVADELIELLGSFQSQQEYCKAMFPTDQMSFLICIRENVSRMCTLVNACTCD